MESNADQLKKTLVAAGHVPRGFRVVKHSRNQGRVAEEMSLWQLWYVCVYAKISIGSTLSGCKKEVDSDHSKHTLRCCYQPLLICLLENLNNYLRIFVMRRDNIEKLRKNLHQAQKTQLIMTDLIKLWCRSFNRNQYLSVSSCK